MTQINIHLDKGDNWISYPEYSILSLGQIFTDSGIYNNIIAVHTYNPISSNFDTLFYRPIQIDLLGISFVEEGKGYHIVMSDAGSIIYDGTPYTIKMTFDILRSSLFRGWNLIGTSNEGIIVPPYWCRIIDAKTNFQSTQIEPTKAYWILYDECVPVSSWTIPIMISLTSLLIFAYVAFGPEIKHYLKKRREQKELKLLEQHKSNR